MMNKYKKYPNYTIIWPLEFPLCIWRKNSSIFICIVLFPIKKNSITHWHCYLFKNNKIQKLRAMIFIMHAKWQFILNQQNNDVYYSSVCNVLAYLTIIADEHQHWICVNKCDVKRNMLSLSLFLCYTLNYFHINIAS